MRNYQRKKNNPYLLPHNLYMRVLYMIRDYDRLREEYHIVLETSPPPPDGMPKGNILLDPTAEKAVRRADLSREIKSIEQARFSVPIEYMDGVWDNIHYGAWFPPDAAECTYRRWKQRYIYHVAKNMNFI